MLPFSKKGELDMKAIVFAVAAALSLTAGVAAADEALANKSPCTRCHQIA